MPNTSGILAVANRAALMDILDDLEEQGHSDHIAMVEPLLLGVEPSARQAQLERVREAQAQFTALKRPEGTDAPPQQERGELKLSSDLSPGNSGSNLPGGAPRLTYSGSGMAQSLTFPQGRLSTGLSTPGLQPLGIALHDPRTAWQPSYSAGPGSISLGPVPERAEGSDKGHPGASGTEQEGTSKHQHSDAPTTWHSAGSGDGPAPVTSTPMKGKTPLDLNSLTEGPPCFLISEEQLVRVCLYESTKGAFTPDNLKAMIEDTVGVLFAQKHDAAGQSKLETRVDQCEEGSSNLALKVSQLGVDKEALANLRTQRQADQEETYALHNRLAKRIRSLEEAPPAGAPVVLGGDALERLARLELVERAWLPTINAAKKDGQTLVDLQAAHDDLAGQLKRHIDDAFLRHAALHGSVTQLNEFKDKTDHGDAILRRHYGA